MFYVFFFWFCYFQKTNASPQIEPIVFEKLEIVGKKNMVLRKFLICSVFFFWVFNGEEKEKQKVYGKKNI